MLVYYFLPFIVSNRYLLFWVSNGHNSVTVQNRTHVYMNFFDHKDLGNHLLQLCHKVVKHPVYMTFLCWWHWYLNCKQEFWRSLFSVELGYFSYLTWIASSNVVQNLGKTNTMTFITNNSTHSSLCISYFAMCLGVYNNTSSTQVSNTSTLFLYI